MHRIDTTGNVDGHFSLGNAAAATPATILGAAWPEAVQEELAGVIEGAGLTLNKENNAQLLAAIQTLAQAAADTSRATGLDLSWASTTSFNLAAGEAYINGALYGNAAMTKTVSGLSANTFYYIYMQAPASGSTITATEITVSSTAPTWDTSKNGWYDATGEKRCLWLGEKGWVVRTDGSANLLNFFILEGHYFWDASFLDVSAQAPSNIWTDYTFTSPPNTAALVQLQHQYSNGAVTLCWRPKDSSSAQGIRTITATTGNNGSGHYLVPVNSNRVAQFAFTGACTNLFSAYTVGFQI